MNIKIVIGLGFAQLLIFEPLMFLAVLTVLWDAE